MRHICVASSQARNWKVLCALAATIFVLPGLVSAQQLVDRTVYSFNYAPGGGFPAGGVVQDASGSLFGATSSGGGGVDDGVVFKLTNNGSGVWTETILYRFSSGSSGANPGANLTIDEASGELYGTAQYVRGHSTGVVFSLTPPIGNAGWTYNVLHTFDGGAGGGVPDGELLLTPAGFLVGTAQEGGAFGGGVVFELQPPPAPGGAWSFSVLHSFNPATEGQNPYGPLAADSKGNLFGSNQGGGNPGIVWELSPDGNGSWSFQVIHAFSGPDGSQSYTGVVRRSSDGVLFGGTSFGGALNYGVIYSLIPPVAKGQPWKEQVIHSFTGGSDGCTPSGLALGLNGVLYGAAGSPYFCPTGSIFRMTPPAQPGSDWTFNLLFEDDNTPIGPLLLNKTGLYGTDYFGGATGQGSVFVVAVQK